MPDHSHLTRRTPPFRTTRISMSGLENYCPILYRRGHVSRRLIEFDSLQVELSWKVIYHIYILRAHHLVLMQHAEDQRKAQQQQQPRMMVTIPIEQGVH